MMYVDSTISGVSWSMGKGMVHAVLFTVKIQTTEPPSNSAQRHFIERWCAQNITSRCNKSENWSSAACEPLILFSVTDGETSHTSPPVPVVKTCHTNRLKGRKGGGGCHEMKTSS